MEAYTLSGSLRTEVSPSARLLAAAVSPSKGNHTEAGNIQNWQLYLYLLFPDGRAGYFEMVYFWRFVGTPINTDEHRCLSPLLLASFLYGKQPQQENVKYQHFIVINITSYKKIKIWKVVAKNIWQKKSFHHVCLKSRYGSIWRNQIELNGG